MPTYPSPAEILAKYNVRNAAVARLAELPSIAESDLDGLDHIGRCRVATELWSKCSERTRARLRTDPHHFVRSCAVLAV